MNLFIIKDLPYVYSIVNKCSTMLPAKLIFPSSYTKVWKTLQKQDQCGYESILPQLNEQLAQILKIAITEVPYYQDLGLKISPKDIHPETAHDILYEFPFLNKKTIMQAPERLLRSCYDFRTQPFKTSGGSTGEGVKIYRSMSSVFWERAFFDYKWSKTFGYQRSWKMARFTCQGIKKKEENPFSFISPILHVSPYHINDQWLPIIYEKLRDYRPKFIHGYPSCIFMLATYMRDNKMELPSVNAIALASERVSIDCLQLLKQVFPTVSLTFLYGLSEATNLAWGRWKQDDDVSYLCENVYGVTENYHCENEMEEIVGTSYWNDVMPLIRYRTQDMGKVRKGIITQLDGRKQEFLITRDGATMPGFAVSIDKFIWDHVELVQVVQNERGKIEFHIKPKLSYCYETGKRFMESQEEKWGEFFDLSLVICKSIERTQSGKLRLIVCNVK